MYNFYESMAFRNESSNHVAASGRKTHRKITDDLIQILFGCSNHPNFMLFQERISSLYRKIRLSPYGFCQTLRWRGQRPACGTVHTDR